MNFDLAANQRQELWDMLLLATENYYAHTGDLPVSPELDVQTIRSFIADFAAEKHSLPDALAHVVSGMSKYTVHTPHPGYFGLFNPRTNFPSILAETITAVFNPQLAAWSHAPFAAEVERYLIGYFGRKFGYSQNDGVFTSGGAEANLTALLVALNNAFPGYATGGLQQLKEKPVIYCSAESHHSIVKSVRVAGLGSDAVRNIDVDDHLRMDTKSLTEQIEHDRSAGYFPLMVIATAGTTGAGAIDPLEAIAAICKQHKIWFHVDAAYGGALVLSSHFHLLKGIEKADSITFDAHKWLSVPMGTSMMLTANMEVLNKTFRITTEYMPKDASAMEFIDPYVHSIQWSRRFNGLKIYLSLLMLGEDQIKATLDRQMEMANLLRNQLIKRGWKIYNQSPIPVICFGHDGFDPLVSAGKIAQGIISNGKAWISVYPIQGRSLLRACVTNYNTGMQEIDGLVEELDRVYPALRELSS